MSEIRVTSVVGENGGDRVGLTTGLTVGPLTGTTGIGATISHQGHAQFAGVCTATSFVGSGAGLIGIGTANPSQAHGFAFMDSQYFTTSATKMNFNNSNSGDISSGVTIDRTNERLTPTVAGTYLVQTQLMFSYSTGGSNIQFVVFQYKNGSEYAYNTQDQYRGSGLVSNVICQSLMTFNGSTDYVEMWAKHNGGGNAIMGVASTFMIVRIG